MRIKDCFTEDDPGCVVHSELVAIDGEDGLEIVGGRGMLVTVKKMIENHPIALVEKDKTSFHVITMKKNKLKLDKKLVTEVTTKFGNFRVIEWPTVIALDFVGTGIKFLGCYAFEIVTGKRGWFSVDPKRVVVTDEFDMYNAASLVELYGKKKYHARTAPEYSAMVESDEEVKGWFNKDEEEEEETEDKVVDFMKRESKVQDGEIVRALVNEAMVVKETAVVNNELVVKFTKSPEKVNEGTIASGKDHVEKELLAEWEEVTIKGEIVSLPIIRPVVSSGEPKKGRTMKEFYNRPRMTKTREAGPEGENFVQAEGPTWKLEKIKAKENRKKFKRRGFEQDDYIEGEEML